MISFAISDPISFLISLTIFFLQDCVCLVAPYPFRDEPLDEFNVTRDFHITGAGEVWYARPQLFSKCTLCPTGAMDNTRRHKEFSLVFFNTFEPLSLTPDSCMQQKSVPMLYARSRTVLPSLYVCPVENVLGRVPLIPCYLNGNTSNTIPYRYRGLYQRRRRRIQDPIVGPVAGSSRSTYGCGATEVRFHGRLLWQTLRPCGSSEFKNPEHREQPPTCVGVSRPLSGPPGLARNNIEDFVISGMLISEFT